MKGEAIGVEVQRGLQDTVITLTHAHLPHQGVVQETGYEGQGMIVTFQADLDPYPDLFRPVMREIIGRSRSPQGVLGPFPGLLLHAKREITSKS